MLRYVIRRVLYAIPILLGVSLLTFVLFYATASPDQMARANISSRAPTRQQIEDWKREHGYNKPLHEQLQKHVTELMFFRFGKSDSTDEDIWAKIKRGVGPSLTVAALVFFAGLLVDLTLALFFAYFRGTYVDWSGTFLMVLLMSISYLVYLITGQYLLAKVLKYFPAAGFATGLTGAKFVMMRWRRRIRTTSARRAPKASMRRRSSSVTS
jgi:peptide/nickel transport system permease protein